MHKKQSLGPVIPLSKGGQGVVILVIILAVLIGGGYLAWKFKQNYRVFDKGGVPYTNIQEQVVSATSDWKTYRSEKYGLEFKAPPSFTVMDWMDFQSLPTVEAQDTVRRSKHIFYNRQTVGKYTSYSAFKDKSAYGGINVESETEMMIDGHTSIVLLFTSKEPKPTEYYRVNIFIGSEKYTVDISDSNGKLSEEDKAIFDTVLKTIVFLK